MSRLEEEGLMSIVVSVELSPVTGGLLRTWTDTASQLWQVSGGALEDSMGRGQLARTEVEPRRYREIGLLEKPSDSALSSSGRLLLPARWQTSSTEASSTDLVLVGEPLHLSPVADADLSAHADRLWSTFVAHLSEVCVETAERGEILLLERGAMVHEPWPYALLAVTRGIDGAWASHLEASPSPGPGIEGWDQAARGRNEDGTDGASMTAPASFETVRGAAFLLAVAAAQWAATPQDLAVTYTASPSGPVELLPGMDAVGRDSDE
jgi:hypothetical protein